MESVHLLHASHGNLAMYNQMLITSPPFTLLFCNPSPPPPLPSSYTSFLPCVHPTAPLSRLRCSQVGKEPEMEALRMEMASSLPHQQQQNQEAAEKGGLVGDSFSVDELLNLGEFGESEKEREENGEEGEAMAVAVAGDEEAEFMETEEDCCNANIASSSPPSSSAQSLSEMRLPAHDAEELEWVSLIIDDSLSEFPPGVAPFPSLPQASDRSVNAQRESRQQSRGAAAATAHVPPMPCATVCAVSTEAYVPPKAKRSKRSRTFPVGWSTSLPFTDFSSTTTTSDSSCSSSSSSSLSPYLIYDQSSATGDQSYLLYESHPSLPPPPPPPSSTKTRVPKKRGRRPKQPTSAAALNGERRCSHCGTQKTPQWRAGPLGAKTLCNACGVRYKSGRLLPEYRPACSPTYVESIHSSSHRKVLELRRLKEAELLHAVGPAPVPTC